MRFGRNPVIVSLANSVVPSSGARNPLMTLNSVVLPAPLGPMMP